MTYLAELEVVYRERKTEYQSKDWWLKFIAADNYCHADLVVLVKERDNLRRQLEQAREACRAALAVLEDEHPYIEDPPMTTVEMALSVVLIKLREFINTKGGEPCSMK